MNKTTKAASTIMQSENLEEPIEQLNPEEMPQSDQLTESQTQKPQPPEGQPLPLNKRVNAAYKLVYGENAEIPIRHESIDNEQDADWFV